MGTRRTSRVVGGRVLLTVMILWWTRGRQQQFGVTALHVSMHIRAYLRP